MAGMKSGQLIYDDFNFMLPPRCGDIIDMDVHSVAARIGKVTRSKHQKLGRVFQRRLLREGSTSDEEKAEKKGFGAHQPGAAPWIFTRSMYTDWVAVISRWSRLGPAKHRLAQPSGSRMRPSNLPCGFHTVTPQ